METRTDGKIITILAVLIILFFSLLYSSISLWDPDFWWHINTGKYILEHNGLPDEDPFTFTPMGKDMKLNVSTLKGYWLAQVILYEIWKMGGIAGTIMVRVMILAFTLFLFWRLTRGGNPYLRLAGLLLAGNTLFYFTGERPQTFIIPLAVLLFIIMQAYLEKKSSVIFILPLVTLLWTNFHKSSFFAGAIIVIYLVSSLVPLRQAQGDNTTLFRREKFVFTLLCILSVVMIFVSPVGLYKTADVDVFQKAIRTGGTLEFLSPFKLFFDYGKWYPSYWICLLVALVILVLNIKKIPLPAILSIIATSLLSLTGARYMVFFTLAASLLFRLQQIRLNGYLQKAAVIIALVPVVMNMGYFRPFNFSIRDTYPFESVNILKKTNPERVFATLDWGGFVGYFLPGSKVFMDGKMLNEDVVAQYNIILEGTEAMGQKEWKNNLNRYRVDAVILPLRDFNTGKPIELIDRLSRDPDWENAYRDDKQALFVRHM
ncbi:MAG TPA: hypothetical protein VN328_08025 [Thermodesulfovibrionales bacterium]|nr:hypothetical protein [Thermodesulfovibrionales bacterium]